MTRVIRTLARVLPALPLLAACDPIDVDERALLEAELADPETDEEVQGAIAELLDLELADEGADGADGQTCFFCPPPPPTNSPPLVKNPYVAVNAQGKAILYMDAAGSYIQTGATMSMQIPYTVTTYGPFSMSFTASGTQFKSDVSGYFPVGSCRMVTVTNPNSQSSSPASVCR